MLGQRRGRRVRDRLQDLEVVRRVERPPAREQLVEHDAEREHVAARVERLAGRLLRRHVRDRPHDETGARVLRVGARAAARVGPAGHELHEPEVRELRVAVAVDQDVARLHVAMQHAGRVRGRERVGDARDELGALAPTAFRRARPVLERAAVDELAHDVLAAVVLADVVYRDDVRVPERGRRRGFLPKAALRVVIGDRGAQELDRDGPAQFRVEAAIDGAAAAAAKQCVDAVVTERRARREIRARRRACAGIGRVLSVAGVRQGQRWL